MTDADTIPDSGSVAITETVADFAPGILHADWPPKSSSMAPGEIPPCIWGEDKSGGVVVVGGGVVVVGGGVVVVGGGVDVVGGGVGVVGGGVVVGPSGSRAISAVNPGEIVQASPKVGQTSLPYRLVRHPTKPFS